MLFAFGYGEVVHDHRSDRETPMYNRIFVLAVTLALVAAPYAVALAGFKYN
jgi:hypothetical protein